MSKYTRRAILTSAGAFAGAYALPARGVEVPPIASVTIVGSGFAGRTAFQELGKLLGSKIYLHIISDVDIYKLCPLSNLTLGNLSRSILYEEFEPKTPEDLTIDHKQATKYFRPITESKNIGYVTNIQEQNQVTMRDGRSFKTDFIILAPGIDIKFEAVEGYSENAAQTLPHAWKAGDQTYLLRDQLHAMPDGGTVIITTPPAPYRCPPGPYERASLIAHYLKTLKPRSKVLLLDANQTFSKQALFEAAWERFYPGIIERRGPGDDGRIIAVNAKAKSVFTDFDEIPGDVVNVIPPQRAGEIARIAGVTDASGWCPVDPVTFESTLRKNIFVIGDAAQVSPMPKSAFAAAQQARICALNLARRIEGLEPIAPLMSNTCYSFLTPDRACSITGVYQAEGGKLLPVSGAGGQSPIADEELEIKEAGQAKAIIDSLLKGAFG